MKNYIRILLMLCAALLLSACAKQQNDTSISVLIEEGDHYSLEVAYATLQPGESASFYIKTDTDYAVVATDYTGEYQLTPTRGMTKLVLEDVRRPARVHLILSRDFRTIQYEANGGNPVTGIDRSITLSYNVTEHIRPNVSIGTDLFARDGYTLTSWNTEPDGTGMRVGLGSRVTVDDPLTLYAQWAEWTPADRFTWDNTKDGAVITGCTELGPTLVIPETIEGHTVTTLAENSFAGNPAETVILPKSLVRIEDGAFENAGLRELVFYDNLESFTDAAFRDCHNFSTLRINAIEDPFGYSYRRESVWVDKLDVLITTEGQDRMIFYGGCSMWYNLDAAAVQQAYGDRYQILNMGINGLASSLLQMEILRCFVTDHDILIHTPEIASEEQLMAHTRLEKLDNRLWAALEYNYDLISLVDIRVFESGLFESLRMYWEKKQPGGSYTDVYLDSKGRYFFDVTGCIPFPRVEQAETLSDRIALDPAYLEDLSRLEEEYRSFAELGVPIYVSFACIDMDQVPEDQQGNLELMGDLYREKFSKMDCVKVFGSIEDYVYHDEDCFDTVYHLLSDPARRCTETWIRDLTPLLVEDGLMPEG